MKRLQGVANGTYEMEVIECDCGYHMGIDASYVLQVEDAFFDKQPECPSCGKSINVRRLLDMPPMEVVVEVSRTCSATRGIKVTADTLGEAEFTAIDKAGDHEFSEKDADYETTGGWYAPE